MSLREWLQPPRRLLTWFIAIIVLPAATLVGLAWRMLEQDQALERQRTRDRLEDAAATIAAALQQRLEDLARQVANGKPPAEAASADFLFAAITDSDVAAHPPGRILYYPYAAPEQTPPSEVFAAAEKLEYQLEDFPAAAEAYRGLARTGNSIVRGAALLGWARCLRKGRRFQEALSVYAELARLGSVPVGNDPAELVGRHARCIVLAQIQSPDLRQEAGALHNDLLKARWRLDRVSFEYYTGQARAWLPPAAESAPDGNLLALAGAVEEAAQLRQTLKLQTASGRKSFWLQERPVLVLWENSPQQLTVAIMGAGYFAGWSDLWQNRNVRVVLTDADGHAVLGGPSSITFSSASIAATEKGLPWTLQVASADTAGKSAFLAGRRRAMMTGIALLLILICAGGYLVARARAREIAVARLQTDFVSAVSHEFRSPLTSMRHLIEMLEQGAVPDEERRHRYYQVLGQESRRLHRLVEHLLHFGRMEAGKSEFHFEPVEVGAVVEKVAAEFRAELAAPDRLTVAIDAPQTRVRADREALARAIWNLLDNAAKYSPPGAAIRLDAYPEGATICIQIQDQGAGIPPEEQKEIFNKFYRGAAAKKSGVKGTGIGLATVQSIVRAHQGEVRIQSAPGQGSTFTISLPIEV